MPDNYPANATLLEVDTPKRNLFAWPTWLTLGVGGLFVVLLTVITGSSFGETARGNTVGGVCGILAALAFLTSFVQAHFKVRRGDGEDNPWLAKTVLFFGYATLLIVGFAFVADWQPGGLNIGPNIAAAIGLSLFAFLGYVVLIGFGWATPPGQLLLHRRLPTVSEYMAKHPSKPGQPIACRKCNSYSIKNYGLNGKRDARRVHFCVACSSLLYKSRGPIY